MTPTQAPSATAPGVTMRHEAWSDTWHLTSGQPGPAGAVELRLPGGVLIHADRLRPQRALSLRVTSDLRGNWPPDLPALVWLLFGPQAADALAGRAAAVVDLQPPSGPRRSALLALLAHLASEPAGLTRARGSALARVAGEPSPTGTGFAGQNIYPLQQLASQSAAAAAHARRLLGPLLTQLELGPAALRGLSWVDRLLADELGDDLDLHGKVPARVRSDTQLEPEPASPWARDTAGRVLIGTTSAVPEGPEAVPVPAMRLPEGFLRAGDHPTVSITTNPGRAAAPWRLTLTLPAPGPELEGVLWARLAGLDGVPLAHIQVRSEDDLFVADLPDVSAFADSVTVEILDDVTAPSVSFQWQPHRAAVQQARRALRAHDNIAAVRRLWLSSADWWESLRDYPNALEALTLAEPGCDPASARAQRLRSKAQRNGSLEAFEERVRALQAARADPAPDPEADDGQPGETRSDLVELQAAVDDKLTERLDRSVTTRRVELGASLRDLAAEVDSYYGCASAGSDQVRRSRARARAGLAVRAWEERQTGLAHVLYGQALEDYDVLADDAVGRGLLDEIRTVVHGRADPDE